MRTLILIILVLINLIACRVSDDAQNTKALSPLRAGAGSALINLPVGHSTAGYFQSSVLAFSSPKDDPGSPFADLFPASRGTYAAPKAKAVLLDNGVTTLAIVRVDAVFTTDILTARAIELAQERLGIDLEGRLILSATHTHGAGCRFGTSLRVKLLSTQEGWRQDAVGHGIDSFNPESVNRVAHSIVDALAVAAADMRPAALGYARGEALDGSQDRRCQDNALYGRGNIDQTMRLIRIDEVDASGAPLRPLALLVNFAMHGTVYGAYNHLLSADAPGLVEYKLEERYEQPVVVMFMQGAAGDVAPGGEGRGSQRMEDVGYRIAEQSYALAQAVTGAATADAVFEFTREVPMQVKSRRIPISHAKLGYAEGEFLTDGGIMCQMGANDTCPADNPDGTPGDVSPASPAGVSCLGAGIEGEGKYHTDILAAQIGPLTIVTLPGEPVSEVGRQVAALAAAEGLSEVLIYGYAQDHNGYLLMPDDWLRGGYEPTISYWGWKFVPYLLGQHADLLHELVTGKAKAKSATPNIRYPSLETQPVLAAPGMAAPALKLQPESSLQRLASQTVRWTGGDPVLGLPRVTVEYKSGAEFVPLKANGWRVVDNTTYEITTEYAATPSYAEYQAYRERNPGNAEVWGQGKWVPVHTWAAVWGIPAWAPEGQYRLRITGATVPSLGAAATPYELTSVEFAVVANTALASANPCDATGDGTFDSTGDYFSVSTTVTRIEVRLAAFYPQAAPLWEEEFNDGEHQIGNFRLWTERGTARFPWAGPLQGHLTVKRDGVAVGDIALVWQDDGMTHKLAPACALYAGMPHAAASFDVQAPGAYTVEFATGDVTDHFGNQLTGRASALFSF